MENKKGDEPGDRKNSSFGGDWVKNAALMSAPTIIIVYPLVGFGLGYLTVKLWHWPLWVPVITMVMGLIQAMREVIKLGKKLQDRDS
jgi:hypothetical protein